MSEPLENVIVRLLAGQGWTVTTAESCTGGLLIGRLINCPGASSVVNEAYVTYSNEAKSRLAGVSPLTLEEHGAVSAETAAEMAAGAARAAGAEAAMSTTGIAGPGGAVPAHDGVPAKPVGLVYFGFYLDGEVRTLRRVFDGSRQEVRGQAVQTALEGMAEFLREKFEK
ncbi:MAG: CinA family protein [Firmicutes bacterium]|nr:CinA family protein [Bacillota bacterium]